MRHFVSTRSSSSLKLSVSPEQGSALIQSHFEQRLASDCGVSFDVLLLFAIIFTTTTGGVVEGAVQSAAGGGAEQQRVWLGL